MRIDADRAGDAADIKRSRKLGGTADKAPFRSAHADFYLDQRDRARLRHHGRMFGAARMQRRNDGGGVRQRWHVLLDAISGR